MPEHHPDHPDHPDRADHDGAALIEATATMSAAQRQLFLGQLVARLATGGTIDAAGYLAAATTVKGWAK